MAALRSGYAAIGAALVASGLPGIAHAERSDDDAWIQAGVYWPRFDSRTRFSVVGGNGTEIDYERDLNLDDRKLVADVTAGVRLGKRFRVEAEYFSLKRRGTTTLNKDIEWEDAIYPANVAIRAGFDTRLIRAAVGYSFVRNEKAEVGARIGAHITTVDAFIEGSASVNGVVQSGRADGDKTTLPMPNVGLYLNHDLGQTFSLHGGADFFDIKLGKRKGGLANLSAGVSARLSDTVGVGLRYRYVKYTLRKRADTYVGRVTYEFSGPALYLEAGF